MNLPDKEKKAKAFAEALEPHEALIMKIDLDKINGILSNSPTMEDQKEFICQKIEWLLRYNPYLNGTKEIEKVI